MITFFDQYVYNTYTRKKFSSRFEGFKEPEEGQAGTTDTTDTIAPADTTDTTAAAEPATVADTNSSDGEGEGVTEVSSSPSATATAEEPALGQGQQVESVTVVAGNDRSVVTVITNPTVFKRVQVLQASPLYHYL